MTVKNRLILQYFVFLAYGLGFLAFLVFGVLRFSLPFWVVEGVAVYPTGSDMLVALGLGIVDLFLMLRIILTAKTISQLHEILAVQTLGEKAKNPVVGPTKL